MFGLQSFVRHESGRTNGYGSASADVLCWHVHKGNFEKQKISSMGVAQL